MAIATGNTAGLLRLLREDAVAYSDGGGKAQAALNPIAGADRVARLFIGLARKAPAASIQREIKDAAGAPSLWLYLDGQLASLFNLTLAVDGRIQTVFAIRNPEKLPAAS